MSSSWEYDGDYHDNADEEDDGAPAQDGDDHDNADDEDDGAPAQDLAILDHLVLALRGHIQVGAQLTWFFYLIAKLDSDPS